MISLSTPNAVGPDKLRSTTGAWALLALLTLIAGCGGDKQKNTTVHGKISVNGDPVPYGLINFAQGGQRPIGANITADGAYRFEAPPGDYQVRIDAPPKIPDGWREGQPPPKLGPRPVPERYANFGASGLTATVKDQGEQTIDFSLQ